MSDENIGESLKVERHDELGRLAQSFNSFSARLRSAFDERDAALDKVTASLERQRQLTADASHELRTPLTRIKVTASGALDAGVVDMESLSIIDASADDMAALIDQLLFLARQDAGSALDRQQHEIARLLDAAVDKAGLRGDPRVTTASEAGLVWSLDSSAIERALVNLLTNAARHTPLSGKITLAAEGDAETLTISVCDTGEGIPEEHLEKVTERFYRVDSARNRAAGGTGLGLAIVQETVQAHGGQLQIVSDGQTGTTVTLKIPKGDRSPETA